MDKAKMDKIIKGACVFFILCTFILIAQKSALKTNQKRLQTDLENVLSTKYDLEKRWESTSQKLADQTKLLGSLQKRLVTTNDTVRTLSNGKKQLLQEIEDLKKRLVSIP